MADTNHPKELPTEYGLQIHRQSNFRKNCFIPAALIASTWMFSITASVYLTTVTRENMLLPSLWAQHYLHRDAVLYSFVTTLELQSLTTWLICFFYCVSINNSFLQLFWLEYMSSSVPNPAQALGMNCHIIANNVLHIAFALLYTHSYIREACAVSMCAFANISVLYLRCNMYARWIQLPKISGSLALAFMSFNWTAACIFPLTSPVPHIGGLVLLWVTFHGCSFHAIRDKDYKNGLVLGSLAMALGLYHIGGQDGWMQWLPSIVTAVALYANTIVTMTLEDTQNGSSNMVLNELVGDEKDISRDIHSAKIPRDIYSKAQPSG